MRTSVLIVDDIELNREILREMLEDEYDVIEAPDGETALDLIRSRCDNLAAVLLDLVMPRMSGIEVLGEIRTAVLFPRCLSWL